MKTRITPPKDPRRNPPAERPLPSGQPGGSADAPGGVDAKPGAGAGGGEQRERRPARAGRRHAPRKKGDLTRLAIMARAEQREEELAALIEARARKKAGLEIPRRSITLQSGNDLMNPMYVEQIGRTAGRFAVQQSGLGARMAGALGEGSGATVLATVAPHLGAVALPLIGMGVMQARRKKSPEEREIEKLERKVDGILDQVEKTRGSNAVVRLAIDPSYRKKLAAKVVEGGRLDRRDLETASRWMTREVLAVEADPFSPRGAEERLAEKAKRQREEDEKRAQRLRARAGEAR